MVNHHFEWVNHHLIACWFSFWWSFFTIGPFSVHIPSIQWSVMATYCVLWVRCVRFRKAFPESRSRAFSSRTYSLCGIQCEIWVHTVDGRNPAPVVVAWFIGFQASFWWCRISTIHSDRTWVPNEDLQAECGFRPRFSRRSAAAGLKMGIKWNQHMAMLMIFW